MKVPLGSGKGQSYEGGLEVRHHLLNNEVDPNKIILMTMGVSKNDKQAAEKYHVPVEQIVSKELEPNKIKELLNR